MSVGPVKIAKTPCMCGAPGVVMENEREGDRFRVVCVVCDQVSDYRPSAEEAEANWEGA